MRVACCDVRSDCIGVTDDGFEVLDHNADLHTLLDGEFFEVFRVDRYRRIERLLENFWPPLARNTLANLWDNTLAIGDLFRVAREGDFPILGAPVQMLCLRPKVVGDLP